MRPRSAPLAALLAFAGLASAASAASVSFAGSSGNLAANATFETSGNNLVITLSNTSTGDVTVPADVLTCLFWNSTAPLSLTRTSAVLGAGSIVTYDNGAAYSGNAASIGAEYAYNGSSGTGKTGNRQYGVGASGIGLGSADIFPGGTFSNSTGGQAPDGLAGGLIPTSDNTATGNGGTAGRALIKSSMVFTLSGLPANFDLASINDVYFQYGTSTTEPGFGGTPGGGTPRPVPLPAAVWAAGAMLGTLGLTRMARRRA